MSGTVADVGRELAAAGLRVRTDEPLAPLTTYAVGGPAACAVQVSSVDEIRSVATVTSRHDAVPVCVVGRGSNLLVSDDGFEGLVVVVAVPAANSEVDLVEDGTVVAPGWVPMPVLARRSVAMARSGLEWCVGIPGTVGGAVRMNAGGHGAEIVDALESADIVSLRSGRMCEVPASRLGLHFRGSALAPHHVVVSARLRTGDSSVDDGQREIDAVVAWRRANQPGGRNAGSVFVNPAPGEGSAGALIDAAGLRGLSVGGARISEKHANFIQVTDGGTASDVLAVMTEVQRRIESSVGVRLRSEATLVGFDLVTTSRFADPRHSDGERVRAASDLAKMMGEA